MPYPSIRLALGAALFMGGDNVDTVFDVEIAGGPVIRLGEGELFLIPELGLSAPLESGSSVFGVTIIEPTFLAIPVGLRLVGHVRELLGLECFVNAMFGFLWRSAFGVTVGTRVSLVSSFGVELSYRMMHEPASNIFRARRDHMVRIMMNIDVWGILYKQSRQQAELRRSEGSMAQFDLSRARSGSPSQR